MPDKETNSANAYKTMLILWIAMVMSQFMLGIMVFVIKPHLVRLDLAKPVLGSQPIVIVVLFALALMSVAASFGIRSAMVRAAIAAHDLGRLRAAYIIGMALCEISSLIGVVSAVAFDYQYFFIFSAIGILAVFLHFPRASSVDEAVFRSSI